MKQTIKRGGGWKGCLGLLVLLVAGAAPAEVFRCERDGRVTFTDTPCAAGAQPLAIAAPSTIASSPGADLAGDYDERLSRERRARVDADTRWLERHAAARADEQRIRSALAENRVVAGMTTAQVRQVWGEPDDVQVQIDQNASRERWVYRGDRGSARGRRTLSFEDGRVAGAARPGSTGAPSQSRKLAEQKKQDR